LYVSFDIGHSTHRREKRGDGRLRASPSIEEERATRGRNGKADLATISPRSMLMLGGRCTLRVMLRSRRMLPMLRLRRVARPFVVVVLRAARLATISKSRHCPRAGRTLDRKIRNPRRSEDNRQHLPRKTLSTAMSHH
jgi:hypothetical protein